MAVAVAVAGAVEALRGIARLAAPTGRVRQIGQVHQTGPARIGAGAAATGAAAVHPTHGNAGPSSGDNLAEFMDPPSQGTAATAQRVPVLARQ